MVDSMLRINGVARSSIKRVAVASVVPPLYRSFVELGTRYFGCRPEFISAARQKLMRVQTARPAELGADLIAGAIGGVVKYGAPLIIVGFGTATTFAAIDAERVYLGTAIAPGIETSVDALVARAAKLFDVPLVRPRSAIGTDTITALQSGIILGFIGQVEYVIAAIASEMASRNGASGAAPTVVATGGLSELVAPHTRAIHHIDDRLVLDGLYQWAVQEDPSDSSAPTDSNAESAVAGRANLADKPAARRK
jgi:type III pantothenate kinase